MPYVYRYIDIEAQEVVYIGKVAGCKDSYNDPLRTDMNSTSVKSGTGRIKTI